MMVIYWSIPVSTEPQSPLGMAHRLQEAPKHEKSKEETALAFVTEMSPLGQSMEGRSVFLMVQLTLLQGQKGPILSGHKYLNALCCPTKSPLTWSRGSVFMRTYCKPYPSWEPAVVIQMRIPVKKSYFLLNHSMHAPQQKPLKFLLLQAGLRRRANHMKFKSF
jgi:hypothetical protein